MKHGKDKDKTQRWKNRRMKEVDQPQCIQTNIANTKQTVQAIWTLFGSLNPFKSHPRQLIASNTSTLGCLLPNATTEDGGFPRTYSSGMSSVIGWLIASAIVRVCGHYNVATRDQLTLHQDKRHSDSERSTRIEAHFVPMCCITAQAPAIRAPGL